MRKNVVSLGVVSVWFAIGCGSKGPLDLKATLASTDKDVTISFKTEPKTKIICTDCTGTLAEVTSDASGVAKTTMSLADFADGHCFKAGNGPERESEKACVAQKKTPKVDIADNGNFTCSGGIECEGSLLVGGASFTKVADGAKVEFEGKTTDAKAGTKFATDLDQHVAKASFDQLMKDDPIVDLPIKLTVGATSVEFHTKVKGSDLRYHVFHKLEGAKNGPVVLPGAKLDAAPAKPHTVLYELALVGTATKYEELDLVAFRESKANNLGTCNYKAADGSSATATRSSTDYVVDVYDRHSGKKVQSKMFTAPTPPPCTATVTLKEGQTNAGYYGTVADPAAIRTWLESLVK